jgi:hypothetical protein
LTGGALTFGNTCRAVALHYAQPAGRATELAAEFPSPVAATWLWHSTLAAQEHDWTVTDTDFERATGENGAQVRRRAIRGETQRSF